MNCRITQSLKSTQADCCIPVVLDPAQLQPTIRTLGRISTASKIGAGTQLGSSWVGDSKRERESGRFPRGNPGSLRPGGSLGPQSSIGLRHNVEHAFAWSEFRHKISTGLSVGARETHECEAFFGWNSHLSQGSIRRIHPKDTFIGRLHGDRNAFA